MTDHGPIDLNMPDAEVFYYPDFIKPLEAAQLNENLRQNLSWNQKKITVYGKTFDVPRLQAWHGDKQAQYQYSNLTLRPQPWCHDLRLLKQRCELLANTSFNSVLANFYRDGNDSMGRHADNETELGKHPCIASVSLGATRNLDFYHNTLKCKVRLPLASGSLLLMKGPTQEYWQHGIAKSKRAHGPRINLTFRSIHNAD